MLPFTSTRSRQWLCVAALLATATVFVTLSVQSASAVSLNEPAMRDEKMKRDVHKILNEIEELKKMLKSLVKKAPKTRAGVEKANDIKGQMFSVIDELRLVVQNKLNDGFHAEQAADDYNDENGYNEEPYTPPPGVIWEHITPRDTTPKSVYPEPKNSFYDSDDDLKDYRVEYRRRMEYTPPPGVTWEHITPSDTTPKLHYPEHLNHHSTGKPDEPSTATLLETSAAPFTREPEPVVTGMPETTTAPEFNFEEVSRLIEELKQMEKELKDYKNGVVPDMSNPRKPKEYFETTLLIKQLEELMKGKKVISKKSNRAWLKLDTKKGLKRMFDLFEHARSVLYDNDSGGSEPRLYGKRKKKTRKPKNKGKDKPQDKELESLISELKGYEKQLSDLEEIARQRDEKKRSNRPSKSQSMMSILLELKELQEDLKRMSNDKLASANSRREAKSTQKNLARIITDLEDLNDNSRSSVGYQSNVELSPASTEAPKNGKKPHTEPPQPQEPNEPMPPLRPQPMPIPMPEPPTKEEGGSLDPLMKGEGAKKLLEMLDIIKRFVESFRGANGADGSPRK